MQKAALILIRLLGVLCVLYAFALLGFVGFTAWLQFNDEGAGSLWNDPLLLVWVLTMGMAVLALHIAWLLWFQLTPLSVRRFGFFVGLIVWQWCCRMSIPTDPTGYSPDGWPAWWQIGWPIGFSVIVGTLVSYVFRRCLFPVVTPPTRLERCISRST